MIGGTLNGMAFNDAGVVFDGTMANEELAETLVSIAGRLNYPMVVVTTLDRGRPVGCLVGFSSQSSMEPFRYTVFLSVKNHTFDAVGVGSTVYVGFLAADDFAVAQLFGEETGDEIDKFEHCEWRAGPGGVPILTGVSTWMVGRVVDRRATGDHHAFTIDPTHAAAGEWPRQLGLQDVKDLDAGH